MSTLAEMPEALGKIRISADQCVISNICKRHQRSERLRSALLQAHDAGKIICPIHFSETIVESAALPAAFRMELFGLQNDLSDGFAFGSFSTLLAIETQRLLMPDLLFPRIWESPLPPGDSPHFALIAEQTVAEKGAYVAAVTSLPYPQKGQKMTFAELESEVRLERVKSMHSVLENILKHGTVPGGLRIWGYALSVGEYLLEHRITAEECRRLIHALLHRKWEAIDYFWTHTQLSSSLEFGFLSGHKKATANDVIDLERLAVGMNDSAVVLCDTPMEQIIRQSKVLDVLKEVRVFSMRQQDEAADYILSL